MQQPLSSIQHDSSDEAASPPQQEGAQQREEGRTWGLGSASAMESLRKQDYRGKRSDPGQDRPTSR